MGATGLKQMGWFRSQSRMPVCRAQSLAAILGDHGAWAMPQCHPGGTREGDCPCDIVPVVSQGTSCSLGTDRTPLCPTSFRPVEKLGMAA